MKRTLTLALIASTTVLLSACGTQQMAQIGSILGGVAGYNMSNSNAGAAIGSIVGAGVGATVGSKIEQMGTTTPQVDPNASQYPVYTPQNMPTPIQ